jgi:hypothetical protein
MNFEAATAEELDKVVAALNGNGWSIQGKSLLPDDKRRNNAAKWKQSTGGIMVPHWAMGDYERFEYREKEIALFEANNIPEEFQGPLSHLAYEQGHAYGYSEIYIHLEDMVDAIANPIQNYGKRVANG